MGRPSTYSAEVAERILAGLSQGKSLRAVCREDGMPDPSTVIRWLKESDKEAFSQQYADVRARSYELLADEILEISDEVKDDQDSAVAVSRDRLRVDSRKWMLAKMLPKVYGDRIDVNLKAPSDVRDLSTQELLERIAAAGAASTQAGPDKPRSVH